MIRSGLMLSLIEPVWLRAGGILCVFLIIALLLGLVWHRVFDRVVARTRSTLDNMILSAVRSLVMYGLIVSGGYYAFLEVSAVNHNTVIWTMIGKGFSIAWIVLAISTMMRIFNAISRWRIDTATSHGGETVRDVATRATFFRKLLSAVVMIVGGVYILSVAGVDTSPIIAGGALGGIVIGIALQDTLSNVFAGFFLNIDRPVKIGDYIRLESGQEGIVEEVGWRYTKVRLVANTVLIIPNNKLSQSIITNFALSNHSLSVSVTCWASYENDLDKIEEVALKIATQIQESEDEVDKAWHPLVRFKEYGTSGNYGNSSIIFSVSLRVRDVSAQVRIQHELLKALNKAFKTEEIKLT